VSNDQDLGYRKPPASTRFRKGRSGNPKGRPRGRKNEAPYETVLGQTVTIKEDGAERRVSAAEAFLLQIAKRGLDGDSAAARLAMVAIEEARAGRAAGVHSNIRQIVRVIVTPGSVTSALQALSMGTKLDRYRATARIALEPWIVEEALARIGRRRLSRDEQAIVLRATRTPRKVRWPEWWEVLPEARPACSRRRLRSRRSQVDHRRLSSSATELPLRTSNRALHFAVTTVRSALRPFSPFPLLDAAPLTGRSFTSRNPSFFAGARPDDLRCSRPTI